ncbi:MAG: MbcA/ParS/Xre antitoxin family protein [Gammaproteobacteria bacterium]|nr:MbcA/ParS/Xre antitoxin family protein [Gammaproteobacteria bacterium]
MGTISDLDVQRRRDMARVVLQVMRDWGVPPAGQARLMGTADDDPRHLLAGFGDGLDEAEEARLHRHMSAVLTIHKALQQMHPQSTEMANYWVSTPHPYFNGRPPLDLMLSLGLEGMQRVIEHLNGRGEWG